jgi:hypothetical protein
MPPWFSAVRGRFVMGLNDEDVLSKAVEARLLRIEAAGCMKGAVEGPVGGASRDVDGCAVMDVGGRATGGMKGAGRTTGAPARFSGNLSSSAPRTRWRVNSAEMASRSD